jgi:RecA/RadA recombinase
MAKRNNINEAASTAIKSSSGKSFDLDSFKKSKNLSESSKFKKQSWIPFSPAVADALSIQGVPMGQVTIARGGSDTGKTTLMIEAAVSAQQLGVLPVFIVTEMKWDFAHAKKMGLEVEVIPNDSTGEGVDYKGFFLYVDRSSLNTIEDVSAFIADILDEQKKGK